MARQERSKDFWFKFEWERWRNSPELRLCALSSRGFWIEIICAMRSIGKATITGTASDFARQAACFPEEADQCLRELIDRDVADGSVDGGTFTITNRKFQRELEVAAINSSNAKCERNVNETSAEVVAKCERTGQRPSISSFNSVVPSKKESVLPEMVARGVLSELAISGRELAIALDDVCAAEMKQGKDPTELRDGLIAAWRDYEQSKPKLSYTKGAAKFFGEGDWRNKPGWPWKDGQAPVVNPDRYRRSA